MHFRIAGEILVCDHCGGARVEHTHWRVMYNAHFLKVRSDHKVHIVFQS